MEILRIKQGESFIINGVYLEDDGVTPKSLPPTILTSMVRTKKDVLVAELDVLYTNPNEGQYTISAPDGTADWPVGLLDWDIMESTNGIIRLSDTNQISVEKAITRVVAP